MCSELWCCIDCRVAIACVITRVARVAGDLLFDPREARDRSYSRDEDHLALMMELLGQMPVSMTLRGKNTPRFFEREGRYLKRIKQLNYWPLGHVLVEKYDMDPAEVRASVTLTCLPHMRLRKVVCLWFSASCYEQRNSCLPSILAWITCSSTASWSIA